MELLETAVVFPGAESIEQTGAEQYKGRVMVKLGPLTMVFSGNLHIEDGDDTQRGAVKAVYR